MAEIASWRCWSERCDRCRADAASDDQRQAWSGDCNRRLRRCMAGNMLISVLDEEW